MPPQNTTYSYHRLCARCGQEFWSKALPQRFCSWKCGSQRSIDYVAEFWRRVAKTDDCWAWIGVRDRHGYGRMHLKRRQLFAHRYAWKIASGEMPPSDQIIGHICDNPSCVRNDEPGTYTVNGIILPRFGHLFRGTLQINAMDRDAKARMPRGPLHGQAKLTEADVLRIRELRATDHTRLSDLAAAYGVAVTTISGILHRRTWHHI